MIDTKTVYRAKINLVCAGKSFLFCTPSRGSATERAIEIEQLLNKYPGATFKIDYIEDLAPIDYEVPVLLVDRLLGTMDKF